MSVQQLKRGTTAAVAAYTPAVGEPVWDTQLNKLTVGGFGLSGVASAVKLASARNLNFTGDATGTLSFDGSVDVATALTLSATGVSAGTFTRVTVDTKGRVTAGQTSALAIANGGTGSTSAAAALTALGAAPLASPALTGTPTAPTATAGTNSTQVATTAYVDTGLALKAPIASPTFTGTPAAPTAAVGTNTTQVATTALVQAEIANKRAWSTWVPTITSQSGTYTSIAATLARYVVIYGICYFQLKIKVTTKGTGVMPTFTLPFTALTGTDLMSFPAQEGFNNAIGGTAQVATDLAHAIIRNYAAGDLVTADGAIVTVQGFYPIA